MPTDDQHRAGLKDVHRLARSGQIKHAIQLLFDLKKNNPDFPVYDEKITQYSNLIHNSRNFSKLNEIFDHVYLMNLKTQKERRIIQSLQLIHFGIKHSVFSAVDGRIGSALEEFDNYQSKPIGQLSRFKKYNQLEKFRGRHFIESPGAWGYIHSFISILQDAIDKNYNRIFVFEDDVILDRHFAAKFDNLIRSIDQDWRILMLGASQYNWDSVDEKTAIQKGFYYPRQTHTCGSFAIGIDSSVYSQLLDMSSSFESPFDFLPLGNIYEEHAGKCFVAFPNIAVADVSSSTIRGPRDQASHSHQMKWNLNNFPRSKMIGIIFVRVFSKKSLVYLRDIGNSVCLNLFFYRESEDGPRPLHLESFDTIEDFDDHFSSELNQSFKDQIHLAIPPHESPTIKCLMTDVIDLIGDTSNFFGSPTADNIVSGRASVIIPTYKRPNHLYDAVQSVLTQDYADIEILIIDDNGCESPFWEQTDRVVRRIKEEYPFANVIFYTHKKNRNGASARNTGILRSTGEYISFLDDDDIYLPGRISSAVKKIKDCDDNIGAVYCGFVGWNSSSNDTNRYPEGNLTKNLLELNYSSHYLCTNTATYKREALYRISGFDETFGRHQDIEFNLRFFEHFEVASIKECLVRLRPVDSDVDNRIYGFEYLDLKTRLLGKFQHVIDKFAPEQRKIIYDSHWDEVLRYLDLEQFEIEAENRFKCGWLQCYRSIKMKAK